MHLSVQLHQPPILSEVHLYVLPLHRPLAIHQMPARDRGDRTRTLHLLHLSSKMQPTILHVTTARHKGMPNRLGMRWSKSGVITRRSITGRRPIQRMDKRWMQLYCYSAWRLVHG